MVTEFLFRRRKLSGAFLLASKLDVEVDMRVIWDKVVSDYRFDEE